YKNKYPHPHTAFRLAPRRFFPLQSHAISCGTRQSIPSRKERPAAICRLSDGTNLSETSKLWTH
ncbi:TPA: hypothetical protein ACFRHD_001985, partial [Neisseria lactamica]